MGNVVSNCQLCGEHSLHLSNDTELNFMQCINCGYVSSDNFLGDKETNEEYKKLDKLLQSWVKETEGRLWIPIQMTLPFGMVYPALVDEKMKWVFAEMQEIPEEEQKNYPIPDQEGKFYTNKYNTDNPEFFDRYALALKRIQEIVQEETQKSINQSGLNVQNSEEIKLPKLKKVK